MSWVLYLVAAAAAAIVAVVGIWAYLRSRRRTAGESRPPSPAGAPALNPPGSLALPPPVSPDKRRGRIRPRIVSATGPPPPQPRPLDPEARPELPGSQPRVTKVASEQEEEAGELEDMAREAIASTKMMVDTLMDSGKNVSAALRQLAMAEELLEKGQAEESLKYASKAMDVAESLEAEQERCPKCHAETKPRWLLCPKCGQPLK